MLAAASPAAAQLRFGPRAGTIVNKPEFDPRIFYSDKSLGWVGGLGLEFTLPVVGTGIEVAALYNHRKANFHNETASGSSERGYIEIPANLMYRLTLPVVSPYVAAGPSVAFLATKEAAESAYKNRNVVWGINAGFGVRILEHVDIRATYYCGLSSAMKFAADQLPEVPGQVFTPQPTAEPVFISGRDKSWTVTVGYYF